MHRDEIDGGRSLFQHTFDFNEGVNEVVLTDTHLID